jgi:hypothetical protein
MSFPSEDEAIDERVEHLGLRVAKGALPQTRKFGDEQMVPSRAREPAMDEVSRKSFSLKHEMFGRKVTGGETTQRAAA